MFLPVWSGHSCPLPLTFFLLLLLFLTRGGDFRQFSVERLLRFLVALDQDVHIVITPHHNKKKRPRPASLLRVAQERAGNSPLNSLSFRTGGQAR